MPRWAVRERRPPASEVLLVSDRLQVIGVDALGDTAQMIQFHPLRDRTLPSFVCISMGIHHRAIDGEPAVKPTLA